MLRPLVLLLFAAPAFANDIVVSSTDSIQAAIASASNGDRVLVEPGTYFEQLDFLDKSIEVIGLRGARQTTINGGGNAPVVRFAGGQGTGTRLIGFTVTGGASSNGPGGIAVISGTTPTIEDCFVTGNSGRFGGGLSGSPVLRRCAVTNNTASLTHGGGIYGAPTMSYCVVAGNRCTSAKGGGLYLTGPALIEDSLFLSNSALLAGSDAGGLFLSPGSTLRRCVVANNSASGGVFPAAGGGVLAGGNSVIESCTIVGNQLVSGSPHGGGVWGAASMINTIVRDNTQPQLESLESVTYSDVGGGFPGLGNFDLDPLFVLPASGDYHLNFGSPCIDTGDPLRLDPDGSRSDVGAFAFATLYTRSNGVPAEWSDPVWPEISALVGGAQTLRVLGGMASAGEGFLTAGSLSGTTPGTVWQGIALPLNDDRYFKFTVKFPNKRWLSNSAGVLDGLGLADTTFTLKPGQKAPLKATTLHHAAMVFPPSGPGALLVTNAVELTIVP